MNIKEVKKSLWYTIRDNIRPFDDHDKRRIDMSVLEFKNRNTAANTERYDSISQAESLLMQEGFVHDRQFESTIHGCEKVEVWINRGEYHRVILSKNNGEWYVTSQGTIKNPEEIQFPSVSLSMLEIVLFASRIGELDPEYSDAIAKTFLGI